MRFLRAIGVLVTAALLATGCAAGSDGGGAEESDTLVVGALLPLSGAAANYGPIYRGGIEAYVKHVNEEGGVNGKKIELKVYDNGYDPAKSLAAVRKAVTEDDVFAFVSTPGTPVNDAVNRYLHENGVPNMWIITGAPQFNNPEESPLIFPFQLSYSVEPGLINDYLDEEHAGAKVGVLYQNDDFGKSFQTAFQKIAADKIVSEQPYESSDSDVTSQIASLKAAGADIVVSFVLAKFAILTTRAMHDIGWDAQLIISSNANDPAVLAEAGASQLEGVIAGSSYPDIDGDDPAVVEYRELMAKFSPDTPLGTSSMQTFAATKLFAITLEKAGKNPTREGLVSAAESLTDVAGLPVVGSITVTPKNHNAVNCMAMTQYTNTATLKFISEPICA